MTRKSKRVGRLEFFSGRKRSKTDHMGRFGGGWQYKLGITAGSYHPRFGMTILVALWTDEYRIKVHPKRTKSPS